MTIPNHHLISEWAAGFTRNRSIKNSSLRATENLLFSYDTCIGERIDPINLFIINTRWVSSATRRHQYLVEQIIQAITGATISRCSAPRDTQSLRQFLPVGTHVPQPTAPNRRRL